MSTLSRRAALGAVLAAPLTCLTASSSTTSAASYDAATARMAWVRDPSHPVEAFTDAEIDIEIDRFCEVLERAVAEPSVSTADLAAKARLILCDQYEAVAGEDLGSRALTALLREVAALG